MRLSLFTPTHDPRWLEEAYASLGMQGDVEWEWIVVPNGDAADWRPTGPMATDARVRIAPFPGEPRGIGALKRFACRQAGGEVLIELDHDDLLAPGALPRILRCVSEGAHFVYSDVVAFREPSWEPFLYDENYGWESYPVSLLGRNLLATRSFWPPTARSLCEIFFAPDHVRAWTREAYWKAGGHDPEMAVGDDHDLVCRTYLSGARFGYTASPDYLYRVHEDNTVWRNNAEIQKAQARNRDEHLYPLIREWCRREGLEFVDLSGREIRTCVQNPPDVAIPCRQPGRVGCIKAYDDALCLLDPHCVLPFFDACYEVLAPAGWLCLAFASTDGRGGFAPHFRSHHNELTLAYVSDRAWAEKVHPYPKARFQLVRASTRAWSEDCAGRAYCVTQADLAAIKDQRQPGRVLI